MPRCMSRGRIPEALFYGAELEWAPWAMPEQIVSTTGCGTVILADLSSVVREFE